MARERRKTRDQPRLMETLARFESAHGRRAIEEMRACFHDDAQIESVASNGRPLGADATASALRAAFADPAYSIRDWAYEELAPDIVLSSTSARHRAPDSWLRDGGVCRLIVGRDGLMWKVKLFNSREEALAYLEQEGEELGFLGEDQDPRLTEPTPPA